MKFEEYKAVVKEIRAGEWGDAGEILLNYGYPPDCRWNAENVKRAFDIIWAAAKSDIKGIAAAAGVSVATLAKSVGIPISTAEKWYTGVAGPKDYLFLMIGYCVLSDLPTLPAE